ncbi:MAG: hypothetical protein Q7R83_02335, partial [bacterium]|nr:hypothetical protein [bacterium]
RIIHIDAVTATGIKASIVRTDEVYKDGSLHTQQVKVIDTDSKKFPAGFENMERPIYRERAFPIWGFGLIGLGVLLLLGALIAWKKK